MRHVLLAKIPALASWLAATLIIITSLLSTAKAQTITVFAASSLTGVVEQAADVFEKETGIKCRLSFAASSTLARQIEAGAGADLLLSANEKWMDYLSAANLIAEKTDYRQISNQLVLIAPTALALKPIETLSDQSFAKILGNDGFIIVGDPDHTPVGLYAKTALEALGLWQSVATRIARADNTRAALAMVQRGETPLGIVYSTDVIGIDGVTILHRFPISLAPISYAFAATTTSSPQGIQFLTFLQQDEGLALFKKYGFVTMLDK